jgi:HK97 gp10 family phage protein
MARKNVKGDVLVGMDELKLKLTLLEEKIGFRAAHDATYAAGKVIEAAWKDRIRSQPWRDSEGHFEQSIEARYIKSKRKKAAQVTVARRWIGVPKGEQPLWYGHRLEFGSGGMPAQPTGRPAFDASQEKALAQARQVLLTEVLKLTEGR